MKELFEGLLGVVFAVGMFLFYSVMTVLPFIIGIYIIKAIF